MLVRLTALFAVLVAAALIAGCGGGSSSEGTDRAPESAASTKAAFIAKADAVCSEYQAERQRIKAEIEAHEKVANPESPQNEKKLGELLDETIVEAEAEIESIRELEPPQADSATIEKLLDTAQEANALGTEAPGALEAGDTSRFGDLAKEVEAINSRAKGMAEGYGLKVCGQAS